MGYEPMCLVPAAGSGGQAYASAPKLLCVAGCVCNLIANFKVDCPGSMWPSVETEASGRQRVLHLEGTTSAECLRDECASACICLLVSVRLD